MLFAGGFVSALVTAGILSNQGPAYFALSCSSTILHLLWQLSTWDVNDPKDCGAKFKVRT